MFIEKLGRAWTWNRGIIVDMRLIHNSGRWLPARTKKKLRNSLSLCHGPMGFRQRSFFFSRNTHTKQAHTDTHTRTHTNEKKTKKQTKPQKGLPKQKKQTKKKLPRNGGGVRCIFVVFRCFLSFASQILVDDSIKWFKRIVNFFFVSESEMEEAGGVGGGRRGRGQVCKSNTTFCKKKQQNTIINPITRYNSR